MTSARSYVPLCNEKDSLILREMNHDSTGTKIGATVELTVVVYEKESFMYVYFLAWNIRS